MFICLECGKKLRTARAAEQAANNGCPKCGGVDIDIDVNDQTTRPRYSDKSCRDSRGKRP